MPRPMSAEDKTQARLDPLVPDVAPPQPRDRKWRDSVMGTGGAISSV